MTPYSKLMRGYVALMEDGYIGPRDNDPNVTYDADVAKSGKNKGAITKVTAVLTSYASGKYTKLAQNIQRMQEIAKETLELESAIKQEGREAIAELFHAEDAAYTRVVETVSFVLQITKDPEPASTVKYAKVLDELQGHLTPELVKVLESIKQKFTTVQEPKAPALSYSAKPGGVGDKSKEEHVHIDTSGNVMTEAPVLDKMKSFFTRYLSKILAWGESYDAKLERLKNSVQDNAYEEEYVYEAIQTTSYNPNMIASSIWNALNDSMEHGSSDIAPLGHGAKGGTVNVKAPDNSTFEITVKQVK